MIPNDFYLVIYHSLINYSSINKQQQTTTNNNKTTPDQQEQLHIGAVEEQLEELGVTGTEVPGPGCSQHLRQAHRLCVPRDIMHAS